MHLIYKLSTFIVLKFFKLIFSAPFKTFEKSIVMLTYSQTRVTKLLSITVETSYINQAGINL